MNDWNCTSTRIPCYLSVNRVFLTERLSVSVSVTGTGTIMAVSSHSHHKLTPWAVCSKTVNSYSQLSPACQHGSEPVRPGGFTCNLMILTSQIIFRHTRSWLKSEKITPFMNICIYIFKFSRRQNSLKSTRADSRVRRFIKVDVSETDSVCPRGNTHCVLCGVSAEANETVVIKDSVLSELN